MVLLNPSTSKHTILTHGGKVVEVLVLELVELEVVVELVLVVVELVLELVVVEVVNIGRTRNLDTSLQLGVHCWIGETSSGIGTLGHNLKCRRWRVRGGWLSRS